MSEEFVPVGLGETIFKDRYARSPEETWQEACRRVANHVSQAEENGKVKKYGESFYRQLLSNKFNPGGRIWYGAGRPKAQLLNCFVIPTADSREGWGKTTSDVIIISGLMGGVGINVSPIRPRGSAIKGTGGVATGAVSLMELINGVGNVIVGGGGRRMALMLALDINHPDLEEFLDAKLDKKKINNANISVVIPHDMSVEEFVYKVKNNEELELKFNGIPNGKTINARKLWDRLVENAWKNGEPGVLNSQLANEMNNIFYHKPLICTNPCVTGDTWIHTAGGPKRVTDILNTPYSLVVDGKSTTTSGLGFFKTGTKPVYTLNTNEGYNVNLTADHRVLLDDGRWLEAQHLVEGDKIVLNNHRTFENWSGTGGTLDEGYIAGHFFGDGTWAHGRSRLQSWGDSPGELFVRDIIQDTLKGKWNPTSSGSYTMLTDVPKLKLEVGKKVITDEVHYASSDYQRGFLCGLFDTDGHVEGESIKGGISIRLSQSNRETLQSVQQMLLRFGVRSKINLARSTQMYLLPDGHGGKKEYEVLDQWRLIISSDCDQFMNRIGFKNQDKRYKYEQARLKMTRGSYRKSFSATFSSLEYIGEEDVYDVQVPNVNAFDANGLYVHNCGEIWLEEYGCCDLGALVLPRFVENGQFDWDALEESVHLGVRFLDDVLTVNHYPLPAIKENCENVRRLGLGWMGLHTMLMDLGMKYDDPTSFKFADKLGNFIKNAAYDASITLAAEKGPFPAYEPQFLNSGFTKTLKKSLRNKINQYGIRNCAILTIAPTGTTSMVSGVSSGIEPLPPAVYWRNYFKPTKNGERELAKELVVEDYYYTHPDLIQGATDISPENHFKMQAIVQKHIDNAVSKTINLSKDYPLEAFGDLWLKYLPLLKGTTIYRYGSRENEPINPVPREEWDTLIQQNAISAGMTVDEFLDLSCPSGVCELPYQWATEKVAESV